MPPEEAFAGTERPTGHLGTAVGTAVSGLHSDEP